jgi:hypothetical protein
MELALSLQTFEGAVMRLMLPALRDICIKAGNDSAQWAFANRWAEEWLARAQRLATGHDGPHVLFGDCLGARKDLDALYGRVLELFCVRGGIQAVRLPVATCRGLERVLASFRPDVLVLIGQRVPERQVDTFACCVCGRVDTVPCMCFRRPPLETRSLVLAPSPLGACDEVLRHLSLLAGGGPGTAASRRGQRATDAQGPTNALERGAPGKAGSCQSP